MAVSFDHMRSYSGQPNYVTVNTLQIHNCMCQINLDSNFVVFQTTYCLPLLFGTNVLFVFVRTVKTYNVEIVKL
jgi:hypothetical protein